MPVSAASQRAVRASVSRALTFSLAPPVAASSVPPLTWALPARRWRPRLEC